MEKAIALAVWLGFVVKYSSGDPYDRNTGTLKKGVDIQFAKGDIRVIETARGFRVVEFGKGAEDRDFFRHVRRALLEADRRSKK